MGNSCTYSWSNEFTLMTLNVEEYYHVFKTQGLKDFRSSVFGVLQGLRGVIEEYDPDVVCFQEHSMGQEGTFTEEDILAELLKGLNYSHFSAPTGENPAYYSEIANVVLWKEDVFQSLNCWSVKHTTKGDTIPGTDIKYTPRSAACVELEHIRTQKNFIVCSTHLLGGRFEDLAFIAESLVEKNRRVEQIQMIAESINQSKVPSVIVGDFNTMYNGYNDGCVFQKKIKQYFESDLRDSAIQMTNSILKKDDYTFKDFYVPFQKQVHRVLREELGYSAAYRQSDEKESMKSCQNSGCNDWIYIKNLASKKDEQIIRTIEKGLSDHNAVMVTLGLI